MDIVKKLAEEFPSIRADRVQNIVSLIDEGNTIPFIARYRKEMTGSCDDQVLREFDERLQYLRNLEKRKEEVAKAITEQGKMTDELQAALEAAATLTEVEDIYRPYKQKKKTRASTAIERGLQPLAQLVPPPHDLAQRLGVVVCPAPADEKGRFDAKFVQRIEDGHDIFRSPIDVEHGRDIRALAVARVIDAVGRLPRRRNIEGKKAHRAHDEQHARQAQICDEGNF